MSAIPWIVAAAATALLINFGASVLSIVAGTVAAYVLAALGLTAFVVLFSRNPSIH